MFNIADYNKKMDKTIEVFNKELVHWGLEEQILKCWI